MPLQKDDGLRPIKAIKVQDETRMKFIHWDVVDVESWVGSVGTEDK